MSGALDDLQDELGALLAPLTMEQMDCMPKGRPGAWSIQQIVEHLIVTYNHTIHGFEVQLVHGAMVECRPTVKQRAQQMFVAKARMLPHGLAAPENLQPPAQLPRENGCAICARMTERLSMMTSVLLRVEDRFGTQCCVLHHVLGPMNAERWRILHTVHGRHHMKQIAAIRRNDKKII